MRGFWTVARHTFAHCLRMKAAGVFILLLGVALLAMPMALRGDGTLAGAIRTYLSYSTTLTAVLLSLVTIFAAVGTVTADVRNKYIFTVATKPVARWQYILGRWFGVVLLDAMLLAIAAGTIYGCAQYLRTQDVAGVDDQAVGAEDRRVVETEIFVARAKASPEPLDVEKEVDQRIEKLRDQNELDSAVQAFLDKAGGDERVAGVLLKEEIRKQILSRRQSVGPLQSTRWTFRNIKSTARPVTGEAEVVATDRATGRLLLTAPRKLRERVIHRGPIEINGLEAMVPKVRGEQFEVRFFYAADVEHPSIAFLKPGDGVEVRIQPTVQLTYKASPGGEAPGNTLRSTWVIENPEGGRYQVSRNDPVRIPATLTIPAQVISAGGETTVRYINFTRTSVTILHDDLAILYQVGSFEVNFLQGVLLTFVMLVSLTGVAIFAASFLSFPVACLLCFSMMPVSMLRGFLGDALKLSRTGETDTVTYIGHYVFTLIEKLLPDFATAVPADWLVKGMSIGWPLVGMAGLWSVAVRTAVAVGLACLIFHKRELARVQV